MSDGVSNEHAIDLPAPPPGLFDRVARSAALRQLRRLYRDELVWCDGGESRFGPGDGLSATVTINHPDFYSRALLGASVGLGEAWMDGHWHCDDLTAFLRIMIRNEKIWQGVENGSARLTLPARKLFHWLRRNSRTGSRRNIAEHYDLGNDLFELFLDPTMAYSSAVFREPAMSLHDAQLAKFALIVSSLKLTADHHLLEIGTGWGGLALYAARETGCRVTTTTISEEQ
ncbi:MAG: class I SAM-dependent methyltransferase, partial [Pseudomonadota bacterium]